MSNHTLLAVVGSVPQVITEAIYAFYHELDIVFDKIVIVTMAPERDNIWQALQGPRGDNLPMLARVLDDYGLPPIELQYADVLVPSSPNGELINDTKTVEEVSVAADFILNTVKHLTQEKSQLHTLLSGGRKAMAFYTGYAMSMYARKHDTLNHVFVEPQYESSEFYYPTPYSYSIFTKFGQRDAKDAKVLLSPVPFIRMRESMPLDILNEHTSFNEAVSVYNSFNKPVSLQIDIENYSIICSGIAIRLSLTNFAFYLLFIDDLLAANEGFDCPKSGIDDTCLALLYLNKRFEIECYNRSFNSLEQALHFASENVGSLRESEISGLQNGMKATFFHQRKSAIAKHLHDELPAVIAEHYDINSLDKVSRQGARKKINYFGILLDPNAISFID